MSSVHFCGKSIPGRDMQVQGPQVGVSMYCLVKKKASMARIEAIRVAEQQDEDREGAKSLIGNDKDLGIILSAVQSTH